MINYYLITKPGIIMGNLFTFAAGFLLAARGKIDYLLFMETLLGLAFIIASACVFNNYIDRQIDKKMQRTKNRALVKGLISGQSAIIFGTILGLIGFFLLFYFTNLLALGAAAIGFFVYVILYSLWKSRTIYGTAIGSIAGAVPPIVGYCAVSHHFDLGAFILFMMLILWQMPHFFSIALYHYEDYVAAQIPVLPVIKGMLRTKVHMVLYVFAFILTSMMLTLFHYTSFWFLVISTFISLAWLILCLNGFKRQDHQKWGREMFQLSLVVIAAICLIIPFNISIN